MSDRGMKKWAPFKALKDQDALISKAIEKKKEVECPILSSDQLEKISRCLGLLKEGQEFELTYYKEGHIYNIKTIFKKVDEYSRRLFTKDIVCGYDFILDIEMPLFFDEEY